MSVNTMERDRGGPGRAFERCLRLVACVGLAGLAAARPPAAQPLPAPPAQPAGLAQGLGTLPLDLAEDRTAEGSLRLSVEPERNPVYAGELVRLSLWLEVERELLEEHMIQPFRRELDLPVQVQAGWLDALVPVADELDVGTKSLALGGSIVAARDDVARGGPGRTAAVVERALLVEREGALVLDGPTVLFATTDGFREDLVQGRVPNERVDALVRADDLTLEVLPLPEEGRPFAFTGAVGRFELRAEAESRRVTVGESLRLTVVIEGDGDLRGFAPPSLPEADVEVRGTLDEIEAGRRILRYDIAPRSTRVDVLPAVELSYFDPLDAAYRTAASEPITIYVDERRAGASEGEGASSGTSQAHEDPPAETGPPRPVVFAVVGGALAMALAIGLSRRSRTRPG